MGNCTTNLLIHRPALKPPSHTSQGSDVLQGAGVSLWSLVLALIPLPPLKWAQVPCKAPGNAIFRSYLRLNEDIGLLVFKRHCITYTSICIDSLCHSFIQLLLTPTVCQLVDRHTWPLASLSLQSRGSLPLLQLGWHCLHTLPSVLIE